MIASWWRAEGSSAEAGAATLLAVEYAFALSVLLVWLHGVPLSEALEWQVFVEGWLLVPPLAALAALAVWRRGLAPALTLPNAIALAAAAGSLRAAAASAPGATAWLAIAAVGPLAVNALVLFVPALGRTRSAAATPLLMGLAVALVAVPIQGLPSPVALAGVAIAAALLSRLPGRLPWSTPAALERVADLVVLALGAWMIFDPHLHYDVGHHNWFLGPINDVLRGGTLLADVVCAYGILSVYFLAGALSVSPFPLSYVELAAAISTLVVLQYGLFYVLLRHLGVGRAHAALAFAVAFTANFIGLDGSLSAYPSLGPMRFGLPWLLLACCAARTRWARTERASRLAESLVVATASLWSLETFFFTLPAYLAIVAMEAGSASRQPGWGGVGSVVRRVAWTAAAVAIIHAGFAAWVWARTGSGPDWASYLALVRAYTPAGQGILLQPIPALGGWAPVIFVYLASLIGCVLELPRARDQARQGALVLVAGATVMGIAQFSIYIGMSSPYRLASAVMPAVFVAAWWLAGLSRTSRATAFCAYAAAGLVAVQFAGGVRDWMGHDDPTSVGRGHIGNKTDGCSSFPACLWKPPPSRPMTRHAEVLIARYVQPGQQVGVALGPKVTTEVLIRQRRRNPFPLNAPLQDALVDTNAERIATAPLRLGAGDVLLWRAKLEEEENPLALDHGRVHRLERRLVDRACAELRCRRLERSGGIVVERLQR